MLVARRLWQWVPLLQLLFPPAGGSNCWVMAHEPPPEPGGALQEPAPRCEQTMQLAGFHNVLLWVTFPGKIIRGRPCLPLIIGFISSEVNFRDVPRKQQKRLGEGCPVNHLWNKKVPRLCPRMCVAGGLMGQPGPMDRLDSPPAITAMVGSNSLSEREVSNPLVQTCLTIRGFETQGLDLQRPAWSPRLQAGGQGWLPRRLLFLRAWGGAKGTSLLGTYSFWWHWGTRGWAQDEQEGKHPGQQSHKPFPYCVWPGTTDTSAIFCLSPGLSHVALGASPWSCVPLYKGNWRPNLVFPAGKATFPCCMCNNSAFVESLPLSVCFGLTKVIRRLTHRPPRCLQPCPLQAGSGGSMRN